MRPFVPRHEASAGLKGDTEVETRVTFPDGVDFAGPEELLGGVLADGLEQLIPASIAQVQEQRLVDEPGGKIRDTRSRLVGRRADFLDRSQVEPAGEYAHAAEQASLLLGEEGITPFHGGAERSLGPVGAPCGLRQQREEIVKVRGDVPRIEAGHARGGKLNRERESVDAAADLSEETVGTLSVERTARTRAHALSKQLNRTARRDFLEGRVRTDHAKWGEPVSHFAVDPQGLSTGRENSKSGKSRRQRVNEIGNRRHNVLTVVDHQEHIALGQPVDERFLVGLPTRPRQPKLGGHFGPNQVCRLHRAEPNDRHATRKVLCRSRRDRDRERGLADASRSNQGRHRNRGDALADVPDLAFPANKPPRAQQRWGQTRRIRRRGLGDTHDPLSPSA